MYSNVVICYTGSRTGTALMHTSVHHDSLRSFLQGLQDGRVGHEASVDVGVARHLHGIHHRRQGTGGQGALFDVLRRLIPPRIRQEKRHRQGTNGLSPSSRTWPPRATQSPNGLGVEDLE